MEDNSNIINKINDINLLIIDLKNNNKLLTDRIITLETESKYNKLENKNLKEVNYKNYNLIIDLKKKLQIL